MSTDQQPAAGSNTFTRPELNHFLEAQLHYILDIQICISNIQSVIKQDNTAGGVADPLRPFINHYVSLAYTHAALSIYKLFAANEKRSFIKLFNKLETSKLTRQVRLGFDYSGDTAPDEATVLTKLQIKKQVAVLRTMTAAIEPMIKVVTDRRNTFYAHKDPDKKHRPEKLSELVAICKTARTVFNKLNAMFKDSTVIFDHTQWTIDVIFEPPAN